MNALADRANQVYRYYTSAATITYDDVAAQFGLTRGQVANDLRRYRRLNGISLAEQRKAKQDARPSAGESRVAALAGEPPQAGGEGNDQRVYARTVTKVNPVPLRAAVFDIETTNFNASGLDGFLICCSILPLDAAKPTTYAIEFEENGGDDKRLVAEVIGALSRFDILIGHYVIGFDLPWLRSRADLHGLPPLRRWVVYDTYDAARAQQIRSRSKSLAFLLDHFRLDGMKTNVYPTLWHDIRSRNYQHFAYSRDMIVEHCELDVLATRELFYRLFPASLGLPQPVFKYTRWAGVPSYAWTSEDESASQDDDPPAARAANSSLARLP